MFAEGIVSYRNIVFLLQVTVWKKTCAGDWTCVSEVAGDVMPNKSVFGDDCYRPED